MQQIGKPPPELVGPAMPPALGYVWQIFMALSNGRSYGETGPNPLCYTEMKAWCDLHGTDLVDWEIDLVKALDATFISAQNEKDR